MNLLNFLNSPTAHALGWTLLHAVWQGFALVLPTAVILHLLQNRSGALRYRVSVLTLLAQVLASAVTFFWYYEPVAAPTRLVLSSAPAQALPVQWQMVARNTPWHQQTQQFLENHLSQFVLIYLIGVAVFGLRLAGGWLYLQRLSRSAAHPADAGWIELTNRLRLALTIRPVVQVRESMRIAVPMVVGVLKPVLLLPVGLATQLSVPELEAVIAHELAHVKRHDYAVNLLQSVVEVLYFFHPALWWLSARVREEREHCCDDLAVRACGGNGRMLAQALARVEELRLTRAEPTATLAMAFATNRQQLLHRVRRVLGVPTRPLVSNGSLAGLTLATILFMSVSVYAVQQEPQPKPKARVTQPKPTRHHKVDKDTEFGFSANRKVDYVIWKGQKLPASRVARLQRQFDQVMAGQLNLDAVKQPDRDILLTIIETNNSFNEGMNGLAEGLAQIDYNTIMTTAFDAANAAGTFPVNVDTVLQEVEKIDYNRVIGDAMASLSHLSGSIDSLDQQRAYHQRQMDSLPNVSLTDDQLHAKLSKLWADNTALHAEIDQQQQSFETYLAQMSEPYKQRQLLIKERIELQKQASFMRKQAGKPEFVPVKNVLLNELSTVEKKLSELDQRINTLNQNEIRPFRDGKHFKQMRIIMDSIRTNEGEIIEVDQRLRGEISDTLQSGYAPKPPKVPNSARPVIPVTPSARAPRPPKPANTVIQGTIVRPATPVVPNARVVPVRPATPRLVPKVAPTPKPERE